MKHLVVNTTKRLRAIGRNDLIHAFGSNAFQKLHEEVALAAKSSGDNEYTCMAEIVEHCVGNNGSINDVRGMLADDVIVKYGSYEAAMSATMEHCREFVEESGSMSE